jgi:putative flippase GtrA
MKMMGRTSIGRLSIRVDLLRYLAVGVANTMIGLSTIYLCMSVLRAGDVISNLIGYAVGITCSFILNRRWTFQDHGAMAPQLVRFLLVLAVAYIINLGTVVGLTTELGVNRYIAQALGILPYTTVGYLGSRFFAFRTSIVTSSDK